MFDEPSYQGGESPLETHDHKTSFKKDRPTKNVLSPKPHNADSAQAEYCSTFQLPSVCPSPHLDYLDHLSHLDHPDHLDHLKHLGSTPF